MNPSRSPGRVTRLTSGKPAGPLRVTLRDSKANPTNRGSDQGAFRCPKQPKPEIQNDKADVRRKLLVTKHFPRGNGPCTRLLGRVARKFPEPPSCKEVRRMCCRSRRAWGRTTGKQFCRSPAKTNSNTPKPLASSRAT